jgi:hypothetical protein
MHLRRLLPGAVVLLCGSLAGAADWPQWRGPERTGISQEKGLLESWPEQGPPLAWAYKNAGLGFSSFAVAGGKVYTVGTRDKDEIVIALDAAKGTELWTVKLGPIFEAYGNWGDGPRSTPTVDGNVLYALGAQGELVCLDVSGKEIWRKNLINDLGGEMMSDWGYSESVLIDGNMLVCTPGGDKGTLAALDKRTGAVLWRSKELTNKAPYSSIMVGDIHGTRQYIQTSYIDEFKGGVIGGFDAKDGKVLWTESIFKNSSYAIAPTPILRGDLVYVTSGYGGGCHLFQIGADHKATELYTKPAQQKAVKCTHGGVLLIGEHIYGHSEPGLWVCQELKSGSVPWKERNSVEGLSGSITSADRLYLYSDSGEVGLAEINPKEFTLVSSFKIPERSKFPETRLTSKDAKVWAHPVIANGHLLLRDAELIFCYDIRDKK